MTGTHCEEAEAVAVAAEAAPRPLAVMAPAHLHPASPLDLQDHERLNSEREQEILLDGILQFCMRAIGSRYNHEEA